MPATAAALTTARLRPGVAVARRDDGHLQVGLDAPLRLVVPDGSVARVLLRRLADGIATAPTDAEGAALWRSLEAAGLLVDPEAPPALALVHGRDAVRRSRARSAARVHLDGVAASVRGASRLVAAAGLALATSSGASDVTLVLGAGPVRRRRVDALVREGRPHLVVEPGPLGWAVGPFVVPGSTACLRCVDAARTERDPRRPVVLDQMDDIVVPPEPVGETLATAWAVRDLAAWADGDEPGTWSATVTFGPSGPPRRAEWRRHPHCGCSWG